MRTSKSILTLRSALFLAALLWAGLAAGADGFVLLDSAGKKHTLADYRGKWLLVNFWATWCPPCLDEIPALTALHDQHKDKDLAVIGIAMDYRDSKEVLRFADDYFISYPIVLGTRKIAAQIGAVDALPATYLYNPQGKLVARHTGALTKKIVEDYIAGKR
ncbi:MAG: TlpA family protein disulfide reductase [Sulfuricella sp.]|nr:TlpA family protein disulfide reductase [Sulfuricella sp.]